MSYLFLFFDPLGIRRINDAVEVDFDNDYNMISNFSINSYIFWTVPIHIFAGSDRIYESLSFFERFGNVTNFNGFDLVNSLFTFI